MQMEVGRDEVASLLRRWQRGEIAVQQVHSDAERLIARWGWPEFPRSDARSIVAEVLMQLEVLNHQLIIEQDIPAILTFLATPFGEENQAWQAWETYWTRIDFEARRNELAGHGYYSV